MGSCWKSWSYDQAVLDRAADLVEILDGVVDEALPVGCRAERSTCGRHSGGNQRGGGVEKGKLTDHGLVPEGHLGARQLLDQQADCPVTCGREDGVTQRRGGGAEGGKVRWARDLPAGLISSPPRPLRRTPAQGVRGETLQLNTKLWL